MALRRNLAPNPSCAVDATGWASAPTGWARSTSVGGTLPRATGFEGSTAVDVLPPRAAVVAGQAYYWSVWVRATGSALSANMLVNYYAALSGGSFVANSGPTVPLNLAAGATAQFIVGPYTVPSGAVAGYLKLNDLDDGCEATAYHVELASTYDGTYFDGATLGASWDGTAGSSTSTFRTFTDAGAGSDAFSQSATAVGPVASDSGSGAESFTVAAAGTLVDAGTGRDSFLIAALAYSASRGRVRVQAFTFGPQVTSVRVSRRARYESLWTTVRGGEVPTLAGRMAHPVDDFEYPLDVPVDYRIEGRDQSGQTLQSATVRRVPPDEGDPPWLKFAGNPRLNRQLNLSDWGDVERSSRVAVYDVEGRSDPVTISDVHSSRRTRITLAARSVAERDALDAALSSGIPVWLQIPARIPLPTMWVSIGDYRMRRPTRLSLNTLFDIDVIEVAAPPPSAFVPDYLTYDRLAAAWPSYEALAASGQSYAALGEG